MWGWGRAGPLQPLPRDLTRTPPWRVFRVSPAVPALPGGLLQAPSSEDESLGISMGGIDAP